MIRNRNAPLQNPSPYRSNDTNTTTSPPTYTSNTSNPTLNHPPFNVQPHNRLNHWGDPIPTIHDNNHVLRILFQNCNGLSFADAGAHLETTLYDIAQYQPHIIALAETNTNWSLRQTRNLLTKHSQPLFSNIQWSTSSAHTNNSTHTIHLRGGTATGVHGPMAAHILETTSDPFHLGRWNRILLKGRTKNLAIYTAYRCPRNSIRTATAGGCFFREWHNIYRRNNNNNNNPDPRQQFYDDLQIEISKDKDNNNEIILMLDANEALHPNSATNRFFGNNDLLPVHELKHGYTTPPTHIRGSQKIDHIACTIHALDLVRTATILPIDATPHADHRGLLIDIHLHNWLQRPTHVSTTLSRRQLLSKHAKATDRYRTFLRQQYKSHNIFQRISKLSNIAGSHIGNFTTSMEREAERLDQTITECKLSAERKACSRIPKLPFSPRLIELQRIYDFHRTNTTQLITGKNKQARLKALASKLKEKTPTTIPSTITEAKLKQQEAKQDLLNAQKVAPLLRQQFLHDNAAAYAKNKETENIAKILRRMEKAEQNINDFRTIKAFLGKTGNSSGLSHIIITNTDNTTTTVTDKDLLESTIIKRNQLHYSQAKETPLGHGIWKDVLGRDGTNEACDNILRGNLTDFKGAPTALLTLLSHISKSTPTDLDATYTFEDFLKGIKKWPERTATSAVGLHLGHLKALIPRHTNDTPTSDLLRVNHKLITIALHRENPYHRWRQQLEIMIEKDPGTPKLERLRIIVLYEADLNLLMKFLWAKKLVWKAHKESTLGEAQGGSRPHRTATDVAAKKTHTYLYSRITGTPLGTFDNDAKSCYDRIILPLAMLCCRSIGMPKGPCRLIANSLNQCIRRVKTANGISEQWYESTDELPSFGAGQGSGGSPSKWLGTSAKLLCALKATTTPMTLINPTGTLVNQRTSDSFVDDTTNGSNISLGAPFQTSKEQ